jgi:hypothetical protein
MLQNVVRGGGGGKGEYIGTEIVKLYSTPEDGFEIEINQLLGLFAYASTSAPSVEPLITF